MDASMMIVENTAPVQVLDPVEQYEAQMRLYEAASGIVDRLLTQANEQVRQKATTEERWLEDKRLYHGRYDKETEDTLRDGKRSRAIIGLARSKSNAWAARLTDMLFPADEKNYGIAPTPVPSLTQEAKAAAQEAEELHEQAAIKVEQANRAAEVEGQDPGAQGAMLAEASEIADRATAAQERESLARTELDEAAKRAKAMEREIDDQLTECQYPARSREVIADAVQLGSGIMKGPVTATRARRTWIVDNTTGDARLDNSADPRPEFRRVDPWAFFPQMNATSMHDCEFVYERHLPTKTMLRKMAKTLGFDQKAVAELLNDGPGMGTTTDLNHLNELRSITGEGEAVKDRYVVWEYHGPLECEEIVTLLRASGDTDSAAEFERSYDILDEHMVVAYFCSGKLLLLHPEYSLDSGEPLYSVFPFEKGEASVLGGIGVPRIIRDPVRAASGAWRMMLDNGALSVGPQIVVDKTQVEPENKSWALHAMKVWLKSGQDIAAGTPPFQVFNIPSNQQYLAGIIDIALKFIDEDVGMPMLAQGEQGPATQTMGGMSMLFNSANVGFRRVVKNFDDNLTEPNIRRLYDWNMQFSKKPEIKGDMQTEARGTSVLLVRELLAQHLSQILMAWSEHPIFGPMLKAHEGAGMYLQSLSISPDSLILDADAYAAKLKEIAESQTAQESPEAIRAKSALDVANITAKSREADGQVQLQVADIHRQTELVRLANDKEMTLADLETKLNIKKVETDSKERIFAGEVGAETQSAREARAAGQKPEGSGGYVNMGVQ